MNAQEQRSVAQRIAELRRLHEEATAGRWARWLPSADGEYAIIQAGGRIRIATLARRAAPEDARNAEFITATRNLLPVLLASWELAETANHLDALNPYTYKDAKYKAVIQAYRSALKGVEDE